MDFPIKNGDLPLVVDASYGRPIPSFSWEAVFWPSLASNEDSGSALSEDDLIEAIPMNSPRLGGHFTQSYIKYFLNHLRWYPVSHLNLLVILRWYPNLCWGWLGFTTLDAAPSGVTTPSQQLASGVASTAQRHRGAARNPLLYHHFPYVYKWVCLKIVYPYTQWLMIIIPDNPY